MSDEPDTDDLGNIEVEQLSDAEYVEVEGAVIIAPHGWGWLADTYGACAIRVQMAKGGTVEVLVPIDDEQTAWVWRNTAAKLSVAK